MTVWIYDSAMGAAVGEVRLKDLNSRNALQVHDVVTISWLPGAHQPRIGHLRREASAAAARDSVLGGLLELIFLVPAAEAAAAPGVAPLAQRLRGTGIDQTFLEEFKAQLRPGTSALVVLSDHADLDEVRPVIERGLARGDVVLMHALLSDHAPEILSEAVRQLQRRMSPKGSDGRPRTAQGIGLRDLGRCRESQRPDGLKVAEEATAKPAATRQRLLLDCDSWGLGPREEDRDAD